MDSYKQNLQHKNKFRVVSEQEVQDLLYRIDITYFQGSLYMEDDLQISQDLESAHQQSETSEKKESICYFEVVKKPDANGQGQRGKYQTTSAELSQTIAQKIYNQLIAQRAQDEEERNQTIH